MQSIRSSSLLEVNLINLLENFLQRLQAAEPRAPLFQMRETFHIRAPECDKEGLFRVFIFQIKDDASPLSSSRNSRTRAREIPTDKISSSTNLWKPLKWESDASLRISDTMRESDFLIPRRDGARLLAPLVPNFFSNYDGKKFHSLPR